ncbi:hypothetical protein LCGC14_0336630 [marine sediment metagenome]|uniref:DUF1937 domain-containing protein n=1 Tax=marine sediment metagenome TaxID=412755 RepID=A0A0F9WMI5_9ZZZZ
MKPSIYLASPYSHPDAAVRQGRYEAVFAATRRLMAGGNLVFSPIVYSYQFALLDRPEAWDSGQEFGMGMQFSFRELMLLACRELWIYTLPGWQESMGVSAEKRIAFDTAIPLRYAKPTDAELALLEGPTP